MPLPDFGHHQRFQRGGGGPRRNDAMGPDSRITVTATFFAAPTGAGSKTSAATSPATAAAAAAAAAAENSQT